MCYNNFVKCRYKNRYGNHLAWRSTSQEYGKICNLFCKFQNLHILSISDYPTQAKLDSPQIPVITILIIIWITKFINKMVYVYNEDRIFTFRSLRLFHISPQENAFTNVFVGTNLRYSVCASVPFSEGQTPVLFSHYYRFLKLYKNT